MSLLVFLTICFCAMAAGVLIKFRPLVILAALPLMLFAMIIGVYIATHNSFPPDFWENMTRPVFF